MKMFLDTNILIDFLLEREPFYECSLRVFSAATIHVMEVGMSSLTVINADYVCVEKKRLPKDVYRKKMDALRPFVRILSVDDKDIDMAYNAQWKDFENAVQYYSAKRHEADFVVTRNIKDFEKGEYAKVITPEQALNIIQNEIASTQGGTA